MWSDLSYLSFICILLCRATIRHTDAFAPSSSSSASLITTSYAESSLPTRRRTNLPATPTINCLSRKHINKNDSSHRTTAILHSTTDSDREIIDMDTILADEARRIALAKKKNQSPSASAMRTNQDTSTTTSNNNDKEWQFFDTARVHVTAGMGGNGCVAFRREKGEAMGGPNGGRGGCGGSVLFVADESLNTLAGLRNMIHIKAGHGVNGTGKNRDGMFGKDIRVRVPCGTIVRELQTQKVAGELRSHGQELMVARGGRGGRGNAAFMTNRRTAPKLSEKGEPGAERWLVRED